MKKFWSVFYALTLPLGVAYIASGIHSNSWMRLVFGAWFLVSFVHYERHMRQNNG